MAQSPYKDPSVARQVSLARCLKLIIVATLVFALFKAASQPIDLLGMGGVSKKKRAHFHRDISKPREPLRIAFVGNSILFANDSPGLLVRLLEESGKYDVTYETCMEGGMSLLSLWLPEGCNPTLVVGSDKKMTMHKLLDHSDGQQWDYVILHDQTRAAANPEARQKTMTSLRETYARYLWNVRATPIFLQTAGYRLGYPELGTFEEFTKLLHDGYQQYADLITESFRQRSTPSQNRAPVEARVSPVGDAFAQVKLRNEALWERLYMEDGVHPSALGTWLQVCVLYATMLKEEPPSYDPNFWKTGSGRFRTAERLPTKEDAMELWTIALISTGIMEDQYYVDHS